MLKVYASGSKNGGRGGNSQNRRGANAPRDFGMPQRRGAQSMSQYYQSGGVTRLGGNARTRGRQATITRATRGR